MPGILFGQETEYAVTGTCGATSLNREAIIKCMIEAAREKRRHLRESGLGWGMFLENGARLYIDCGLHPEFATPEADNPWDAVRYVEAGHRILESVARDAQTRFPPGSEVMVFRGNVDYGGWRTTWGCHESYLHRVDPRVLPQQIIPHLVTRTIYTGAGGFNPFSGGLSFTLSPRLAFIQRVISGDSTAGRGIFHTKNESLSERRYHRLHILCGDSVLSQTAGFLKMGATALVVAMIDGGVAPGAGMELAQPLAALRTVARDETCQAMLSLSDGRRMRAIDIQRHYLERAEACLEAPFMPPWTGAVCAHWRRVLDLVEGAPASVARTLDWAIKWDLYRGFFEKRGFCWRERAIWNRSLEKIRRALISVDPEARLISLARLPGSSGPVTEALQEVKASLARRGRTLDQLESYLELSRQLFEIDMRFGQLGEGSIFASLERASLLNHRIPGIDNIEHAISHPPAGSRAAVRGQVIRREAGRREKWTASWCGIDAPGESRHLDLSDPFTTQEHWRPVQTVAVDEEAERAIFATLQDLQVRIRRVLE